MAEHVHDDARSDAFREQQACRAVAQVMEAQRRQLRVVEELPQLPPDRLALERRSDPGREHEASLDPTARRRRACPICRTLCARSAATHTSGSVTTRRPRAVFVSTIRGPLALDPLERRADHEPLGAQVHVRPVQPEHLAPPEAQAQREHVQRLQTVTACPVEQRPGLRRREHTDGPVRDARPVHELRDVPTDEAPPLGLPERDAEHEQDVPYRARGEPVLSLDREHLLYLGRRELPELHAPEQMA